MTPGTVIHIRHGETDWNAAQRLQGGQERPLNEIGIVQAADAGRRLQALLAELGRKPTDFQWICSPMQRARLTMEIVRETVGLPIDGYAVEQRFREISFGQLEGLTYEEVEETDPASMQGFRTDKWRFVPPDGENYVMLTERVRAGFEATSGDRIIVAHGGVFRALIGILRGRIDETVAEFSVPQDRFFLWQDGRESWV
ncbi:MAG: histidine phosphatase family protein [Ancalomicrobiaceae bacterium]|nr:histidine phosphatase family protein [Ancalomicrobiaceae bacterium]